MEKIAKFEKVSFEQFKESWLNISPNKFAGMREDEINGVIHNVYNMIQLPTRATKGSAGHDFKCPININLEVGKSVMIPTGIRCKIDSGWVLKIYPRSGFGFKFGAYLANTVGIIDEDYYNSTNEGHIFVKLVNDSILAKDIEIKQGDAFCQGLFEQYGITIDDDVTTTRNGGLGSTGR